jgi:hypothetical protein
MLYPPYSPDISRCDLFFGLVEKKLITKQYETVEALPSEMKRIILEIPGNLLLRVFANW